MVFNRFSQTFRRWFTVCVSSAIALVLLSGCSVPQVSAQDRLFLDLSIDLIGSYTLPKQSFESEPIGGISAIAYDIRRDRLYALSDNRDRPRFYTFTATGLVTDAPELTVESVTYLKDAQGNPYPSGSLDPEGMALTPRATLLISSEGSFRQQTAPTIGEYDIATGQLQTALPVPKRYLPTSEASSEANNLEPVEPEYSSLHKRKAFRKILALKRWQLMSLQEQAASMSPIACLSPPKARCCKISTLPQMSPTKIGCCTTLSTPIKLR